MPTLDAIDTTGTKVTGDDMKELLKVDPANWLGEVESIREHYKKFGDKMPVELTEELNQLEARLKKA